MGTDALIATLVLAVMCGGMWMLARVAKRRMGVGSGTIAGDALKVVGKRPLDQKSALYVIEIAGGRHILIGAGTDGTVTKLDDISSEEYGLMVDAQAPAQAPKLRLAKGAKAAAKGSAAETKAGTAAAFDAEATEEGETEGETDEAPRFATVGESFQHFLGKARHRRASGE